jgi:hypothetical protein
LKIIISGKRVITVFLRAYYPVRAILKLRDGALIYRIKLAPGNLFFLRGYADKSEQNQRYTKNLFHHNRHCRVKISKKQLFSGGSNQEWLISARS